MCELSPVTFHGDIIFCIDYQDQPFTPMKPIVENMGLDWAGQFSKLRSNKERWGIEMISIPTESGVQKMVSIPVRKLPAYLGSINPKKVRTELRERIELYQAESDDALWDYWMNGRAERPDTENGLLTPSHRSELKAIVDAKLSAFPASIQGKARAEIWTRFNRHFRIAEYAQLPAERMAEARDSLIEMEVKALKALPVAPTTPPVPLQSSSLPTSGILSAELARYAAEFEALAHTVEDLEQLLIRVRRLSYPLTSEAARTLVGGQAGAHGHLEAVLEEHLGRSHRLAQELVPCARLGINVMRDLALAQGR